MPSNDLMSTQGGTIPEETHPTDATGGGARNDDPRLPDDRLPVANPVDQEEDEEQRQEKRRLEERLAQQIQQLRERDAAAAASNLRARRGWALAVTLLVMVAVAAIVAGVVLTRDSNEKNLPQPTLSTPSFQPTLAPPPKCFETKEELQQALDKFMLDSDEETTQLQLPTVYRSVLGVSLK
jgi:hypothetical protein